MDCKDCKRERSSERASVPYIVHEGAMASKERTIKRLWILCIVLVVLLCVTNGLWIYYESQFVEEVTTIEAEQETTRGNNFAVVGDIIGEAESAGNR